MLPEMLRYEEYASLNNPTSKTHQKNFGTRSISGDTIIDCRPFSIDSPKTFTFEGSFDDSKVAPIFGIPGDIYLNVIVLYI